jgi:hypothetical protein
MVALRPWTLLLAAFCILSSGPALPAAADPPIPVDAFITMNGNPVGTQVTPAVMRTGTLGFTGGNWTVNDSAVAMKVGPGHFALPMPVQVGTTVYPRDYPTQSMAYDSFYSFNNMQANFPDDNNFRAVTAAGYITLGIPNQGSSGSLSDLVRVGLTSGAFAVFQLRNGNAPGYAVNIETDANGTVHSPNITVIPGASYWYCLKADFGAARADLNIYTVPGFNLVGSVSRNTKSGSQIEFIRIGNGEEARTNDHTHFNYFEDTLIDWTNAAFPLIPPQLSLPTPPQNLRIRAASF